MHKAVPKISLLPYVDISSFFFFSLCDYGVISLVIERFVKVLHMDNHNKPSTKGHKREPIRASNKNANGTKRVKTGNYCQARENVCL